MAKKSTDLTINPKVVKTDLKARDMKAAPGGKKMTKKSGRKK